MLRWIVSFVVTSILRIIQNRAVCHMTIVELEMVSSIIDIIITFLLFLPHVGAMHTYFTFHPITANY
jgi:hypothetical protein